MFTSGKDENKPQAIPAAGGCFTSELHWSISGENLIGSPAVRPKLLFIVNVHWFFLSHRLPIALAAMKAGYEVHVAAAFTGAEQELARHGIHTHELKLNRSSVNPFNMLREFVGMAALIRQLRPDILHLVTIKPVLLGGIAARLLKVRATVFAISGFGTVAIGRSLASRIRWRLVEGLYRTALSARNMKIIVQNSDDREVVTGLLGKEKAGRIALIEGSGVDIDRFTPDATTENSLPVVVLASRLLVDKGVWEFVQAAARVHEDPRFKGKARFVLVGSIDADNPSSLTERDVDSIGRARLVEIWGQKDDMADTLRRADIVVLPSYREGLPKVLLEAAACGKPVITTDAPGCRQAIIPGETGLLVPPKDVKALAYAIGELLVSPERRTLMGQAGRSLAIEKFALDRVVAQHLSIYGDLLGDGR